VSCSRSISSYRVRTHTHHAIPTSSRRKTRLSKIETRLFWSPAPRASYAYSAPDLTTPARAQAAVASAGAASRRGGYYRKAKRGHTLPIHINNTDRLTVASVDTPASLQRRYSAAAPTARRLSRPNTVATGDGSALTNPDAARRARQPPGQPGRSWRRVLRGPRTPAQPGRSTRRREGRGG